MCLCVTDFELVCACAGGVSSLLFLCTPLFLHTPRPPTARLQKLCAAVGAPTGEQLVVNIFISFLHTSFSLHSCLTVSSLSLTFLIPLHLFISSYIPSFCLTFLPPPTSVLSSHMHLTYCFPSLFTPSSPLSLFPTPCLTFLYPSISFLFSLSRPYHTVSTPVASPSSLLSPCSHLSPYPLISLQNPPSGMLWSFTLCLTIPPGADLAGIPFNIGGPAVIYGRNKLLLFVSHTHM